MSWLVLVPSFAGGLVGAAAAAWVALRRQRQDARGEWRERLDRAIALVTPRHPREPPGRGRRPHPTARGLRALTAPATGGR